jgi:glyoxylase-like metal-dependent hydrolase (beta-lactamase superfamily II)
VEKRLSKDLRENIVELHEGILQIKTKSEGSHIYLIKGADKNVLIDTGMAENFPLIREKLKVLGIEVEDIDMVILTHEHFDHIGAATFFVDKSVIAAHSLAANKIELQDEFTTLNQYFNAPAKPLHVHFWLEDNIIIDLGNYQLQIIYTPGHTSGCICVYEISKKLLFSGDTVFSGGTVSDIRASGNASDYYNSLRRLSLLKVEHLYPAHGRLSDTPEEDIGKALQRTQSLFEESKILFEALSQKVLRDRRRKEHEEESA